MRVPCKGKNIPGKIGVGMVIFIWSPSNYVPIDIVWTWVGAVYRGLVPTGISLSAAIFVIGEATIDSFIMGVSCNPFWAIHSSRSDYGAGFSCMNANLSLGGHPS